MREPYPSGDWICLSNRLVVQPSNLVAVSRDAAGVLVHPAPISDEETVLRVDGENAERVWGYFVQMTDETNWCRVGENLIVNADRIAAVARTENGTSIYFDSAPSARPIAIPPGKDEAEFFRTFFVAGNMTVL